MFSLGARVVARIEGELEHIVASPRGLRASIRLSDSVSITVPYAGLASADPESARQPATHDTDLN